MTRLHATGSPSPRPTGRVAVVDDDESVRESLQALLSSLGLGVEVFPSGGAFLASSAPARTECLILDVRMPDMTGPALQRELRARGHSPAIVFITAYADPGVHRLLLAEGAVALLLKPFDEEALRRAVQTALRAT